MIPSRPWLLPPSALSPGYGVWKAENNQSAEMVGAVAYVPADVLDELLEVARRAVALSLKYPDFKLYAMEPMQQAIDRARAALQEKPHE